MSDPSMTDLLKKAIAEAIAGGVSIRSIARAADTSHPSLIKFLRGDQSIRLDKADNLARYFGIVSTRTGKNERRP